MPQGCQTCNVDFAADETTAANPSDPRRQGPLYVEARNFLQPAVDYYARAVRAADALGTTTGDLLSHVRLATPTEPHSRY